MQVLKIFVFILLNLSIITLSAQNASTNVKEIDLVTVLEIGGVQNLTVKAFQLQEVLAKANVAKAKEWWIPNIYAGIQTHQLWGAAMNTDGKFALDLSRSKLWNGLGLDANWNIANGIYETKAARLQAEAAEFNTKVVQGKVLLEIVTTYYDFVASQLYYQAYQNLVKQTETISDQIAIQVQSGLQYESDLLLSKSNLNHLKIKMLQAKMNYEKQSATLVQLLKLDPKTKLKLKNLKSLSIPLELNETLEVLDFEKAYQQRPEFAAAELGIKYLETNKKKITAGLLIPQLRLNTNASYFGDLRGPVSPLLPAQYPDTKQLYPTRELNVSLMWQIPLASLITKGDAKVYDTKILIQKNKIEQLKTQVNEELLAAKAAIESTKEQMEMAVEANRFAEQALQQTRKRLELGTVRPYEILQAQEILIQSKLDELKSITEFIKAQFRLTIAKGSSIKLRN